MGRGIICLLIALSGLGQDAPEQRSGSISDAVNRFALELHRELAPAAENLVLSPYSIALCLAMAAEGAGGKTGDEMRRVLHLPERGTASLHSALRKELEPGRVRLFRDGPPQPSFEWAVANRLWGQEELELDPEFLRILRAEYGAALASGKFRDRPDEVRREINEWVSKTTRERIRDLLGPGKIHRDTVLVLVNALFLEASWANPFSERSTRALDFHTPGEKKSTPFLRQTDRFRYTELSGGQLVELPYLGHELSMVIVLPSPESSLRELESQIDAATLERWIGAAGLQNVVLEIPKFSFRSGVDLVPVLKILGMRSAFDRERADFSGITAAERLFIDVVAHQGFISIDEEGTEAAAATAVGYTPIMRLGPPRDFSANRPFLFLIRHRSSGTILFLGRVVDPTSS